MNMNLKYFIASQLVLLIIGVVACTNDTHDYFRVDAERVNDYEANNPAGLDKASQPNHGNKKKRLISIVRGLLDTEIKKLESSITDSVMEEVINYYGTKLDSTDVLKAQVDTLNGKVDTMNETLKHLEQNYQFIIKNHQNLVNTVRNSINNAKRTRAKYLKLKYLTSAKSNQKNISNTRALNENKFDELETTTTPLSTTSTRPGLIENLKSQLLKDLETKYSHLIDDKLSKVIIRNLNNEKNEAAVAADSVQVYSVDNFLNKTAERSSSNTFEADEDEKIENYLSENASSFEAPTGQFANIKIKNKIF